MQPFDATLEHLREQFVAGAQQRLRRVGDGLRRLADNGRDEAAAQDLLQHVHRLAGAAATYGYPAIARSAAEVETELRLTLATPPHTVPAATVEAWRAVFSDVRRAFGLVHSGALVPMPATKISPDETALLVMTWGGDRDKLSRVLQAQGLRVRTASDRATARRALRKQPPSVLVVDLAVQGGTVVQVVDTLREQPGGERTAVVFLAADAEFADRLDAVRAGADAVLEGAVEPDRVAAKIRELLRRQGETEGRVLYLEGDPDQAAYVERLLRAAGYEVTVCIDPARFGETVEAVQPQLILMETTLPGASGGEVARALRQDARFRALPLLFLTTESGAPDEAALRTGDGFLRKPIEPRVLLTMVQTHLERARLRSELRELDGLTNLLHHSAFVRRLSQWMTEGDPARFACSLAMVDIDATAELNARFGHNLTDGLLRELGAALQADVPGVQLLGRYDGDGFALLVVDQPVERVTDALEALRQTFAGEERYAPDGRVYQANLSIGLARYQPGWRRPQVWLAASEDALRQAKRQGGGRARQASATSRPNLHVARHEGAR